MLYAFGKILHLKVYSKSRETELIFGTLCDTVYVTNEVTARLKTEAEKSTSGCFGSCKQKEVLE